jgi:hypothetical protein
MSVFRATRERPPGPSERTRAWIDFIGQHAEWLIAARRRWHEGDPATHAHRFGLIGSGAGLLALALAVERLFT